MFDCLFIKTLVWLNVRELIHFKKKKKSQEKLIQESPVTTEQRGRVKQGRKEEGGGGGRERAQRRKENRGRCARSGSLGGSVCLFSLWRWWEPSGDCCQFSPSREKYSCGQTESRERRESNRSGGQQTHECSQCTWNTLLGPEKALHYKVFFKKKRRVGMGRLVQRTN